MGQHLRLYHVQRLARMAYEQLSVLVIIGKTELLSFPQSYK